MPKFKPNLNIYAEDSIISPSQSQMDQWVEAELAEAEQDNMLSDDVPNSLFSGLNNESID